MPIIKPAQRQKNTKTVQIGKNKKLNKKKEKTIKSTGHKP
jgi:hypothetical protein